MSASTQYHDNTDTTLTDAYRDGLEDGAVWDLDGYKGDAGLAAEDDGWDSVTINVVGLSHVLRQWGVESCDSSDYDVAYAVQAEEIVRLT